MYRCLIDMKIFLLIFMLVVVAFNEAFMRLAESSVDTG